MNPIRIALGIFLATLIASPARAQDQGAPSAAPAPHAMRIRVGASVAASQLLHVVQPQYPPGTAVTGAVVLHVIIDYDGTVTKAEVVSGDAALTQPAVDAVKQWRYRPTKVNGQGVQVDSTVTVVFALDKKGRLKPQPKSP
jgi:periplasmic protein TonB